jgi:hypothetical protein
MGRTWEPTPDEVKRYAEVRPMVSNPWTILVAQHPLPPIKTGPAGPIADLPERLESKAVVALRRERDRPLALKPAWHGTLLPKTDADIWLATAFADYEKVVAHEQARRSRSGGGVLSTEDRDRQAVELFAHRSGYMAGARAEGDIPLAKTRPDFTQNNWYRVTAGKGVLVLSELHQLLGDDAFVEIMESFGKEHGGQEVTAAQFQAHLNKTTKGLDGFIETWTRQPGLPTLRLGPITVAGRNGEFRVEGEIQRDESFTRMNVDVTVETGQGEVTKRVLLDAPRTPFTIQTDQSPVRVVVDKLGSTARANGGAFTVTSFYTELEQTLIVYGTGDEVHAHREAAEELQRAIVQHGSNYTVPVKSDQEVTEADLKGRHLLLIGRPDSNRCVARFREALPIAFGSRSFSVRNEVYAHPRSAVIVASDNPLNPRYSLVVLAGLSAESTRQTASMLLRRGQTAGEVVVLPAGRRSRSLVLPARDLVQEVRPVEEK